MLILGGFIVLAGLMIMAIPSSPSPYGSSLSSSGCVQGILMMLLGIFAIFFAPSVINIGYSVLNSLSSDTQNSDPSEGLENNAPKEPSVWETFNWELLGWILLGTFVTVMILVVFGKVIPHMREKKREEERAAAEEYARLIALETKYNQIKARMQNVTDDYSNRESSPETILFCPLILDVKYEPTRIFQNNFKNTQEYFENIQEEKLDDIDLEELENIVEITEKSWYELVHKASNVGFPIISKETSKKAQKMLQIVIDESSQPEERIAYAERLVKLLEDEKEHLKPYQFKQKKEFNSLINIVSSRIMDASKDGKMPTRLQKGNLLALEA